jgi:hypothetical protein
MVKAAGRKPRRFLLSHSSGFNPNVFVAAISDDRAFAQTRRA